MYLFLVILMVVAAILMCFIVLIQNSKGGGLASGFSSSNEILGVRKTTDVLEKLTWGLAVFMVVASIATAYVMPSASQQDGSVMNKHSKRRRPTHITYRQALQHLKQKLLLLRLLLHLRILPVKCAECYK